MTRATVSSVPVIRHDLYTKPEIYDTVFSWDPSIEAEFYGNILRNHVSTSESKIRPVVEFGCGTGRVLRLLSRLGFRCLGIDLSSNMSRYAYERGPRDTIDVLVADMAQVPARAETFAAAICTLSTFNYLSKTGMLTHLKEVHRVLATDGVYVIDFLLGIPENTEEEWTVSRDGLTYVTKWSIQPVGRKLDRFLETISVRLGSKPLVRSKSITNMIERKEFYRAVRRTGLYVKNWYRPFASVPLDRRPARGRMIAVVRKDR